MKKVLLSIAATVLAGCATTSPPSVSCVDARKSIDLVEVESPTSVIVRQSRARDYRLTLGPGCSGLTERSALVSLSNGMGRTVYVPGHPPIWANEIIGSGRICGKALDRLMVRRSGDDLSLPPQACNIVGVERL